MKALSSLGIGMSLVFGCLFLALVAEIYYLLWWKKRLVRSDIEGGGFSCHGSKKYPLCLFFWTKPSFLTSTAINPQEICPVDEGIEAELMRLHHLTGPPRFLFTIKEETKEDLVESSEDGGTPLHCCNQHGLNPIFESSRQDELVRVRSSPPPIFKFLRDAEDKLYKKILKEEALRACTNFPATVASPTNLTCTNLEEVEGSFINFLTGKNNREKGQHPQHHSSPSQVLPLS